MIIGYSCHRDLIRCSDACEEKGHTRAEDRGGQRERESVCVRRGGGSTHVQDGEELGWRLPGLLARRDEGSRVRNSGHPFPGVVLTRDRGIESRRALPGSLPQIGAERWPRVVRRSPSPPIVHEDGGVVVSRALSPSVKEGS